MKKRVLAVLVLAVGMCSYITRSIDPSCIELPSSLYNYSNISFPVDIMNNITEMDNMPGNNPTTDAGATLGRVLFYDPDLSKNHKISCSSCHLQEFSFTDTARFSVGFEGRLTARNSMGLVHARFQKDSAFFWDNRAATLEIQVLEPIKSSIEMGLNLDTLIGRVAAKPFYPPLFRAAFGTETITTDRISKALAQFVRSINSFGSKFRQGVNSTNGNPESTPFTNFTAQENLGKNLFMDIRRGNCQACHTRNIMVPQGSKNIGLDLVYADNGVGAATGNVSKNGQFSVPSLINVELTAPYMHDGRYKTLEQVINFYSDSIKPHPQLDGFLREIIPGNSIPNNNPCNTCPPRKIQYTPEEKAALIAFLKTLKDTTLTKDPRWSSPFCEKGNTGTLNPLLSLNCYPNPAKPGVPLNIRILAGQAFTGTIHLFSETGQLIHRATNKFSIGNNSLSFGTDAFAAGLYVIHLTDSNGGKLGSIKMIVGR
jgi:cytochrome c peroxidase